MILIEHRTVILLYWLHYDWKSSYCTKTTGLSSAGIDCSLKCGDLFSSANNTLCIDLDASFSKRVISYMSCLVKIYDDL